MAQLRYKIVEFDALGVQTLTISFSEEYWARGWLQDTESPFPLLLDPERRVYDAYGMGSSALRAWGPNVLWRYARLMMGGKRLLPAQGDPHQMGGDFIVDAEGVLRLVHASKDPVDRPEADELLATLRSLTLAKV